MPVDYGADRSCALRTVVLPFPLPGGGVEMRAVTAVQPPLDGGEVSGRAGLIEALIRRLTTARGRLIDVVIPSTTADYGTHVVQWINDDLDPTVLASVGPSVQAELEKDERVLSALCTVTQAGDVLILSITVTDGAGPFPLVLSVSQATIQVLSGGR